MYVERRVEQEITTDWAGYVDFTWAEGRKLTRFLNYNRSDPVCCDLDRDRQYACLYRRAVDLASTMMMLVASASRGIAA